MILRRSLAPGRAIRDHGLGVTERTLTCANCGREVTEAVAELEGWRFHTYGGELVPFCPECAETELDESAS